MGTFRRLVIISERIKSSLAGFYDAKLAHIEQFLVAAHEKLRMQLHCGRCSVNTLKHTFDKRGYRNVEQAIGVLLLQMQKPDTCIHLIDDSDAFIWNLNLADQQFPCHIMVLDLCWKVKTGLRALVFRDASSSVVIDRDHATALIECQMKAIMGVRRNDLHSVTAILEVEFWQLKFILLLIFIS